VLAEVVWLYGENGNVCGENGTGADKPLSGFLWRGCFVVVKVRPGGQ